MSSSSSSSSSSPPTDEVQRHGRRGAPVTSSSVSDDLSEYSDPYENEDSDGVPLPPPFEGGRGKRGGRGGRGKRGGRGGRGKAKAAAPGRGRPKAAAAAAGAAPGPDEAVTIDGRKVRDPETVAAFKNPAVQAYINKLRGQLKEQRIETKRGISIRQFASDHFTHELQSQFAMNLAPYKANRVGYLRLVNEITSVFANALYKRFYETALKPNEKADWDTIARTKGIQAARTKFNWKAKGWLQVNQEQLLKELIPEITTNGVNVIDTALKNIQARNQLKGV